MGLRLLLLILVLVLLADQRISPVFSTYVIARPIRTGITSWAYQYGMMDS